MLEDWAGRVEVHVGVLVGLHEFGLRTQTPLPPCRYIDLFCVDYVGFCLPQLRTMFRYLADVFVFSCNKTFRDERREGKAVIRSEKTPWTHNPKSDSAASTLRHSPTQPCLVGGTVGGPQTADWRSGNSNAPMGFELLEGSVSLQTHGSAPVFSPHLRVGCVVSSVT